ncbi:HD domain-containing protein [Candidatus Babeliales bacterium]|nr:HD domain-containing protein [Candidatus Babeliales bacterium]
MNMQKIIKEIETLVENACKKDSNVFGYWIWSHHIVFVVKYAKLLAKKVNADTEVVEIAALLHDYAAISNKEYQKDHHIHGTMLAEKILKNFNYSQEKIEKVKRCIFSHRESFFVKKLTIEEECVASADAMAHIDQALSLFLGGCKAKGLGIDEGILWLKEKLEKSWNKLCPQAKEIMKGKYLSVKNLLELYCDTAKVGKNA